jgi:hypothetical protein
MSDNIEFYDDKDRALTIVKSARRLTSGEIINIGKVTWQVDRVTYAVDYSDMPTNERCMRAIVYLISPTVDEVQPN